MLGNNQASKVIYCRVMRALFIGGSKTGTLWHKATKWLDRHPQNMHMNECELVMTDATSQKWFMQSLMIQLATNRRTTTTTTTIPTEPKQQAATNPHLLIVWRSKFIAGIFVRRKKNTPRRSGITIRVKMCTQFIRDFSLKSPLNNSLLAFLW